uniref:Uncharacterized protein n=1 Tax=Arundo donax TaxID=35708 RepID=A0A0A9H8G4_ARUDO
MGRDAPEARSPWDRRARGVFCREGRREQGAGNREGRTGAGRDKLEEQRCKAYIQILKTLGIISNFLLY